ncbi:MAG: rhodanese-like domain-containing protein [Thermoleophilia bacterium]|nr:rhodanese-like domain-containing protein [Thermoleophilia bacterium]
MIIDIRALDDPDTTIHISSPHGHVNLGTLDEQQYLDTLPTDQLIVVVGATGRKAGQVTPILRMLGYDAVTLRSGMTAWAPVPDSQRVLDQITGADYPVVR